MENRIPIIIDCDTGVDDAGALMMACASEKLNILAVTTVSGNVALEHTHPNTMNCLNLFGRRDIPVAKGAAAPLAREGIKASAVHGFDGLRNYQFAEQYTDSESSLPAAAHMAKVLEESEERVTIVALGPLTNVAILLMARPELKDKIEKIVFMGTSDFDGNPTPVTTFNVLVDPEAFELCLNSGIDFYGCSLNALRGALVGMEEVRKIQSMNSEVAKFLYHTQFAPRVFSEEEVAKLMSGGPLEEDVDEERLKSFKERTEFALLDEATVAFVIKPELFTWNKYYCKVECGGTFTCGMTYIDKRDYYHKSEEEKNIFFVETVDGRGFAELYLSLAGSYEK